MADDKYSRNRQKVYDLLKGEGYTDDELGGSADALFQDRNNATMAYQFLTGAGYSSLAKDQDDFNSRLFAPTREDELKQAAEGQAMFDQMKASRKPATSSFEQAPEEVRAQQSVPEVQPDDSALAEEGQEMFSRMRSLRSGTSTLDEAPEEVRAAMAEAPAPVEPAIPQEQIDASFVNQGGLEKEEKELENRLEEIRASIDRDYSFNKEYDERNKAYREQLKKLTDTRYAGNDFSGIDAETKWLKENEGKYNEGKEAYDAARREAEDIETQLRFIKQERNRIVLDAQKKENQKHVAPITTSSGGMAPGYDPSYSQNRGNMVESEQFRYANDIIDRTQQLYNQGDKAEAGLHGDLKDRVSTANRQFWVQGVLNNIDTGTFSGGATEGAADIAARMVADKRTKIANNTLKELGHTSEDVDKITSAIAEDGKKLEPIVGQLKAAEEELKSMKATIDEMVANGDPDANTYISEYNKKIDAYQKIYNEYEPILERYKKNYDEYNVIKSAIMSASQKGMTDGERAILDALDAYNEAKDLRNGNVSVWSSSGAAAEQSAEFIADFLLTKGFDKIGAKAASKLASSKLLRPLGEKGAKAAAKFLSDMEVSAIRTSSLFPRNLQAYGENLVQMTGGPDELGRYKFDRSYLNAALNTALSQYIEYWSEGFGEYFGAAEQALFRKVTSMAPYTAIGKTLNQYRGSIGNYLDYGKFDGMFNEMLEEVVGSTFNALNGWLSGDRVGDKEALKDFFAGEQLATLALSFLPMSAISAHTNLSAYSKMRDRYDKGSRMLDNFVSTGRIGREELDNLVSNLSQLTPEQAAKRIVEIGEKVKGPLPRDYAPNMIGYLEGSYAMSLRHDEWEDSQEKMQIVGAYTGTYSNPNIAESWDLSQGENATRAAALDAGFSEEDLDRDAFILGQEAREMRESDPARSEILLNYATAKASMNGLRDKYDADTRASNDAFDADVRDNFNNDGIVMLATINVDGKEEPVFIKTKDATITQDGKLTTPTGNDGLIEYRPVNGDEIRTAKASEFSNADVQLTDVFITEENDAYSRARNEAFETAKNTISPAGQSRALAQRQGQSVIVKGNGAYEPVQIERMTDGGMKVVISGDKEALKGIATAAGVPSPGGSMLEIDVTRLYPLLATEDDGTLTTYGQQPQAEAPVEAPVEAPAQAQAPAPVQAPAQTPLPEIKAGTKQTININGTPTEVDIDQVGEDGVWYSYTDENGDEKDGVMNLADFRNAMPRAEAPAQAPAQAPAAPVSTSNVPVDEKTGKRIFDAPSVTPAAAYRELYEGVEPGSRVEANRDKFVGRKVDESAKAVKDAQNRIARLQARRAAVDDWELRDDEDLDDLERRQNEERAKIDAEIAQIQSQLPELQRIADHWEAVRDLTGRKRDEKATTEKENRLIERAATWTARTGVNVRICHTIDEVDDPRAREALEDGTAVAGWFNENTGEVGFYLPNIADETEMDKTFIHEVVSHKGLRNLLGDENYGILCDKVWDQLMSEEDRQRYLDYNSDLELTDEEARRAAADEWIAALSENLDIEANQSLFNKFVEFVKEMLDRLMSDANVQITKEDLQNLLRSSLANYEANTEKGRKALYQKREIDADTGGAIQVSEDGKNATRLSVRAIAAGAGLEALKDGGNGNVAFVTTDGRKFDVDNPITVKDLKGMKETVLSYMMKDARDNRTINRKQEDTIWQAYADQLNAFLAKGVASNGLTGFDKISADWEWWIADSVYKSVSPNGDKQYLKSIDITRVCKKNEAVIKAISEMQNRLGCGISPGQILDVYLSGIKEGYQVPCPVCYVFSHYLNNGKYATIAVLGQRKYGQYLVDPSTLSEEEKEARVQEWVARLRDEEEFNERNAADIEKARNDLSDIEEEINKISKALTFGEVPEERRQALMESVTELDAQYRAALDLYAKAGLDQWIKQFAIREVTDKDAPKVMGEDGKMHSQKKWVLWEDSFQGFPEQYALDLRLTAETIEKYPAIQRLRKSGGSAAGKEIHFASNNDIGDIPMMLGASKLSEAKNYYKMAAEATDPKEREQYRKLAAEKFADARKYAQQQSLRGGQRMWSWSDNIERLAPDVFANLLQLQMLGGALQSYSKQLEGVNLVASMGGYVNGSLMGYGKGWQEVDAEDIETLPDGRMVLARDIEDTVTEVNENGEQVQRTRPLTKKGAPVFEIGGKNVTLLFDDVVGIDPYGRDGKKGLFDLNNELDKAGNIIVGMNDTHVIAAMADDRIFFIIPWHASGNSTHVVMQMLGFLGAETTIEDLTDYTKVQEEKDAYQLDKNKKEKKIPQETIDIWEKYKDEKKYRVGIDGGTIPSGSNGYLSKEQKHYRELRAAIFDGTIDQRQDWKEEVMADAFLSQVYRHVKNDVTAGEMTNGDNEFIYPYEYWNERSTYKNADENGFRYLEYCRRLGHKPKFTGGYVKKTDTHYGNFAGMKGYWKLLIDRRMYGVDGKFQGLTPVTTEGYDPKYVDPQWTGENFHVTRVATGVGVDRMVDRAIAMEEENFPNGVPTVNYDLDREEAVTRYKDAVAAAEEGYKRRTEAKKSRAAKKPKADKEASGTKLRVRTEAAPKKTVPVFKLMRLGQDGKLYPLFIDSANPTELKTWYDADSPALKDIENLPSDTYTGTRTRKENGKDVKEEYKYGTYLVDNETGEAMPIAEFKQKYKDGRKYSSMKGNPNVAAVEWAAQNGKRWIRIEEKRTAQKRYGGAHKSYYNYGINGSGSVSTFAMRPGWHAGSLPTMRQIGKGDDKNLRDDSFVWVKGFVPADIDYNEEAQGNPDKDIPTHIPTNGYYLKATNANADASQADRVGWYVAGSFYADEIIGDEEARRIIDEWNANHPDEQVEYDYPRESGKVFNAETMQLEDAPAENRSRTRLRRKVDPESQKLFDAAKERFGATNDLREAGYILPDGTMLDFSGRHWTSGGDNSWLNGMRQVDHREISDIEFERDGNTPTGLETDMSDFIRRGAIRINFPGSINLATKPTREQESVLERLIRMDNRFVRVDFGDGSRSEHYADYDYARPAKVIDDIDGYFDDGVKPGGSPYTRFRVAERDREAERERELGYEKSRDWRVNKALELISNDIENGAEFSRSDRGIRVNLGLPGGTLLAAGVLDQPIVTTEYDLIEAAAKGYGDAHSYHPFDINDLKDLATLINHPIAVFRSRKNPYDRVLLLDKKGYNTSKRETGKHDYVAIVGSRPVKDDRGNYVLDAAGRRTYENKLLTIYPSDSGWRSLYSQLKEVGEGSANVGQDVMWVDNKKISSWVKGHASNVRTFDAITQKDIANIQKEFENKQDLLRIDAENLRPSVGSAVGRRNPDTRFRTAPTEEEQKEARISSAEREATDKTLDAMGEEFGVKINRVSRDQMPAGHKSDKGYYDPSTGEMTICMDNVTDERDAIATVIHETVGHKGLRDLFGSQFKDAMARIYAALDAEGRAWVNGYIRRHNLQPGDESIVIGMEEYLSHLAERANYNDSLWERIKDILGKVIDLLFGTDGFTFTNRELNYILRASYEHLKNPNWLNTINGRAMNALMKRELGINETDPNKPTDPDGPGTGLRYRDGETGNAAEDYDADMDLKRTAIIMENQNADLPVKIGMERAMKEVGKTNLAEDEDYLTRHNLSSSRAETESHDYMLFRFTPMLEQVREIQARLLGDNPRKKDRTKAYERIMDYLYAVSALERNAWKNAQGGEQRDWSGITSLMGRPKDEWQEAEADARAMIDAFRAEVGDDAALDELWNRIRACTDYSLEHAYKYGLLTTEEFERLHGTDTQPRMWNYYLPLRGFDEKTAAEIYGYIGFTSVDPKNNSAVVKKANGRWTKADNPLANMLNIAQREIVQGNENWARQALYRFTMNLGENSLLSVRKPWYVRVPGTKSKWQLAQPRQDESIEDFETRMREAKNNGEARQGRKGLTLDHIITSEAEKNQHLIRVKVGGEDRLVWVNGNPAFARSVSGAGRQQNMRLLRRAGRVLSNLFTTYSLDFTAKNLIRDTIYSRVALIAKEDKAYRRKFRENWWKNFGYGAFAFPMMKLAAQWDSGKLQTKGNLTEREQAFIDFMHDGGQTGYTIINSVDEIKKSIERSMRRSGKDVGPVTIPILGHYAKAVKTLNEAFELLTRFTAYQTSRDMGRSGQRAAFDAKEISVNFNRRGAQSGEGVWGNIAAYLGATHYFYNAGVQGFDNFLRLFKADPKTMGITTTGLVMMGILTPFINSLLAGAAAGAGDGGDGDDDWYWNLPEWVRRNNLILGFGKWYVAVPLPVEFRAFYGLGDIAAAAFAYQKYPNRTFGRVAGDMLSTASGILPFNPIEGYNGTGNLGDALLRGVFPDAGMFFVDWATNRDYTGRALAKENPFSHTVPKSQGAYASTSRGIVWACQTLAEKTGGNIDIAPGVVRDFLNNYGGGFFRVAEDMSKILFTNDEHPFRYDNIPFLSGFTGHIDNDRTNTFTSNTLREYGEVSDKVVRSLNAVCNTDEITATMAYGDVEDVPEKYRAKVNTWKTLHPKDYELGKMYRDGMNNQYKMKQYVRGEKKGQWYKSKEIEKKGVNALKKEWKDLREAWAAMPDKTAEEKSAKAEMDLIVQDAWHKYYDAEANLAEELLNYEYGKK